ncbi:hypothetical protein BOTBODRAFT_174727 [Botryobasidium botryosum FD-172 SS1]|uniref:DUF6532 domain-containing protein n=1 Tax=Botryobasidium botryosum (strain FD-172 SS1) TaxID=930990 RepID=A0A067MII7_BOTB1|nr:hypothetical protein BOTBODRAFT_174727 [Botryobasidium botryosum FD-172 SS1]
MEESEHENEPKVEKENSKALKKTAKAMDRTNHSGKDVNAITTKASNNMLSKKPVAHRDSNEEEDVNGSEDEEGGDENAGSKDSESESGEEKNDGISSEEEESGEEEPVSKADLLKRKKQETPMWTKGNLYPDSDIEEISEKPKISRAKSPASQYPALEIASSDDEAPQAYGRQACDDKKGDESGVRGKFDPVNMHVYEYLISLHAQRPTFRPSGNAKASFQPDRSRRNVSISSAMDTLAVDAEKDEPPVSWPSSTHLSYPPPDAKDQRIGLKPQSSLIQAILKKANDHITVAVLFTHPFPGTIVKPLLLASCVSRAADTHNAKDICLRIQQDKKYCTDITSLPDNRLAAIQKSVKDATDKAVVEEWLLGRPGINTAAVVQNLLNDCIYIYPGNHAERRHNSRGPFLNPVFLRVLKSAFFTGDTSFVNTHFDLFNENNTLIRPAVPPPMLGLIGAAFHISLSEWASGSYIKCKGFSAGTATAAYDRHIDLLERIQKEDPHCYWQLKAAIFKQCRDNSGLSSGPSAIPINMERLAMRFYEEREI